MLRVLFILLAVLAVVLAIILDIPELYFASGLLLFGALAVFMVRFFRRKDKEKQAESASKKQADDDLASLGILEIRPRGKTPGSPPEQEHAHADEPEMHRDEAAAPPRREADEAASINGAFGVSPATVKKKTVAEASASDVRLKKDFLIPYLHALQVAVEATTVCLLKQEQPQRYQIEGIVSKNSYARSQGQFAVKMPLFPAGQPRKAVHLHRIGEKGMPTSNLGYYLEPIAVRQLAATTVPLPSDPTTYLLIADTMEEGGLGTKRQRVLLSQFAALLGTVLEFRDTSDEEVDAETEVQEVRPRRDIIAEEMRNARADGRELALALVHLNRAEAVAEMGADAVLDAEAQLEARLREAAEDTAAARIERFGELTYGIFYHGSIGEVETWAVQLQHDLADATDLIEGGISIGVAMMQERHEGPDALRADATEALRAAYESGACTILE